MKLILSTLLVLIIVSSLKSQNTVITRIDPKTNNSVNIKWYSADLINKEGFNVYRKESSSTTWEKINSTPIKYKNYTIPAAAYQSDKTLKEHVSIVDNSTQIKGLLLLAIVVKTFKSDDFSQYIGIRYDDKNVEFGKTYEYKVTKLKAGKENDLATSLPIKIETYKPTAAPQKIEHTIGNKKVTFKWEPEPNRYYGVDIYRKSTDSTTYRKVNKETIMLSQVKDSKGNLTYGDKFYVDSKLKPRLKYTYYFVAIDFFGQLSQPSETIDVKFRDSEPPSPPDSISKLVDTRKVAFKWGKNIIEDDLIGYNVYRTKSGDDSTFIKVNPEIIPLTTKSYTDQVTKFGNYLYKISAVDIDLNEGMSNEFFVDVFDNEPPAKPKNVIVQSDTGKLMLKWEANTEDDLLGYLVYRTINKNDRDNYVLITSREVKKNYYTDDLPDNAKNNFLYKIVALDESMNRSPYSEFAMGRMPDILPPNPPFLKSVSINEKQNTILEWFPNVEPDLLGYNVYRKDWSDSSSVYKKLNVNSLDFAAHNYTDRSVTKDVNYEYYIEAMDSSLNISKPSNHWKHIVKKQEEEIELKFTSFEGSYNEKNNSLELKWKLDKEDEKIKGFVIYKMNPSETILSPVTEIFEQTKFTDKSVSKDNSYSYQVRVYNDKGDVFKSDKIIVSTVIKTK